MGSWGQVLGEQPADGLLQTAQRVVGQRDPDQRAGDQPWVGQAPTGCWSRSDAGGPVRPVQATASTQTTITSVARYSGALLLGADQMAAERLPRGERLPPYRMLMSCSSGTSCYQTRDGDASWASP
jgi:hypothetical protein